VNRKITAGISLFGICLVGGVTYSPLGYAGSGSSAGRESSAGMVSDADRYSTEYLTFGEPIVREVKDFEIRGAHRNTEWGMPTDGSVATIPDVLGEISIALDRIINLGQKLWQIVEAGRPVVDVQSKFANAVPDGIKSWESLEGWKVPSSKVFQVTFRNGLGGHPVDFNYRLLYTYGGSLGGKGSYLTHVTVIPSDLAVGWGYHFSAQVEVPSVTNAGTSINPIAAMEVTVSWKVDTILRHSEGSSSYYVRGDGSFQDLSEGTDLP
jgi:hypothetical protein